MECLNCEREYPCKCEDPRFKCGGCNFETTDAVLDNVAAAMRKVGLSPDDGLMCADCFVEFLAQDWKAGGEVTDNVWVIEHQYNSEEWSAVSVAATLAGAMKIVERQAGPDEQDTKLDGPEQWNPGSYTIKSIDGNHEWAIREFKVEE